MGNVIRINCRELCKNSIYIKTQIARLKESKNKLRDYIADQLKEYEKGIEDYKKYGIEDYTKGMAVGFKKCLGIIGEKENE